MMKAIIFADVKKYLSSVTMSTTDIV